MLAKYLMSGLVVAGLGLCLSSGVLAADAEMNLVNGEIKCGADFDTNGVELEFDTNKLAQDSKARHLAITAKGFKTLVTIPKNSKKFEINVDGFDKNLMNSIAVSALGKKGKVLDS